jgi:hypothetical protein
MNKSEQRYFHMFAHIGQKKSPHYYLMFAIIRNMENWDEAILDESLKNKPFYSQKAVIKHQLYQKLLDALHWYHLEQDEEEKIKRKLHQAYLLIARNLPKQAEKLLDKAIQLIIDKEIYNCWPEAIRIKQMLLEQSLRKGDPIKAIDKWQRQSTLNNSILQEEQTLKWQKIHAYQRHFYGNTADQHTQRYPVPSETISTMGQADYQQMMALQAFQEQRFAAAYKHNLLQLKLLESCLNAHRGVPNRYLSVFYNLLIDQLQLEEYEELYKGLGKLRSLPKQKSFRKIKNIQVKAFTWSFQLELNAFLQQQDFASGYSLLIPLKNGIKEYQKELGTPAHASLMHLGGLFAFHYGDYILALDFLTPIYQQRPDLKQAIYRYAHLLYLLAHYETGNWEWLENTLVNSKRQFRQAGIPPEDMDNWLLEFLKILIQAKPGKELSNQQASILEKYDANAPIEKFLHLRNWLTKKEKGQ